MYIRRTLLALALLSLAQPSLAEWSSDPEVNFSVADGSGDQILPKIAPTADGGGYLSWFDSIGNGFDVRVQKLDANGNEVFAHNGVLVSDRAFSSVQDYDLDIDAAGNALLVFRDNGGVGTQITAAKISPTGTLLWGAGNVQLTATTDFVAAPKIAGTSDGGAVVAWTQDVNVHLQKLDATGSTVWAGDLVLSPDVGSYSASDLHDAGNDAILSFVHQLGGFGSPRHILAQKYDGTGAELWGAEPLAVFDSGSLQFGNFPSFRPDGLGGALFSWYDAGSLQLQCYAQHVSSAGVELFPHNGSAASTNATRVRVSPSITYDAALDETYLFWTEENSGQSQFGLYGQMFDSNGDRQWTENGSMLVGLGSASISFVRALRTGSGTFVYWDRSPSFGADEILGARVVGAGVIDTGPFPVGLTPSSKSRLTAELSTNGFSIVAWSDDRVDSGDVLVQNVNSDGSLGLPPAGVESELPFSASLLLSRPYPNPASRSVVVGYQTVGSEVPHVSVFDAQGRVVRPDLSSSVSDGQIRWDGNDALGRPVVPGVYFIRAESGNETRTQTVTMIR